MRILENHTVLMFLYAVATALFFSFLWHTNGKERLRMFLVIFVSLFVGGIVLAWVMLPFPGN